MLSNFGLFLFHNNIKHTNTLSGILLKSTKVSQNVFLICFLELNFASCLPPYLKHTSQLEWVNIWDGHRSECTRGQRKERGPPLCLRAHCVWDL